MRARRVLRTLDERGPDAARAVLDELFHPITKVAPFDSRRWYRQQERLAALAIIGHGDALALELDGVSKGSSYATARLARVGLLGLAVRVNATAAARQMEELADRVERDRGRGHGLPAELRTLAKLVRCFHEDRELPDEPSVILGTFTCLKGCVRILGWRAESLALRQAGRGIEAVPIDAEIRKYTRAFD